MTETQQRKRASQSNKTLVHHDNQEERSPGEYRPQQTIQWIQLPPWASHIMQSLCPVAYDEPACKTSDWYGEPRAGLRYIGDMIDRQAWVKWISADNEGAWICMLLSDCWIWMGPSSIECEEYVQAWVLVSVSVMDMRRPKRYQVQWGVMDMSRPKGHWVHMHRPE